MTPVVTARTWAAPLGLTILVGALVAGLALRDRTPPPDLRPVAAVMPIQANMIGGDNDSYSTQFTDALTSELARLGPVRVAPFARAVQFMGQHPSARDAAAALQCRYLVHTSIDDEAPEILLVAHLTDAATEQVMWESEYRGAREDIRGLTRRMAGDISAAILAGGPVR